MQVPAIPLDELGYEELPERVRGRFLVLYNTPEFIEASELRK